MSFAVRMKGITKHFGAVAALNNVDLEVAPGTIHAIVGENGAGKTTLMRVLYGALHPDSGTLEVEGNPVRFTSSREAIEAGVGMVSQHYGIIPAISCLQNLILGAEGGTLLNLKSAAERAQELADHMGFQFDWLKDAETLSPAGAQKLEILKLLWRKARIMILDEPTAMLSPADSAALFESLDRLAAEGATIILVTHRLPEVLDHCSRVTVLRGGVRVDERLVSETNGQQLAELIVGGSVAKHTPREAPIEAPVSLEIKGLTVKGSRGDMALKGIDLKVRHGEMLGIAGVDGSGQRELFHTLVGLIKAAEGSVILNDQDLLAKSPSERIEDGVRIIAEDRHEEAVIEDWSLDENASLGLQRLAPFANGPWVDSAKRQEKAGEIALRFKTKHGGLNLPMASLSGGNQQRFVAARALCLNPKLILAFQPARGLDLKGTQDVYDGIRAACAEGAAAIVVSFDLDELLEQCDRLAAMNGGRLAEPDAAHARDRTAIGRLMVGVG